MNQLERITQFKLAVRNMKDHVKDGNQLAILKNGQLVALAQYGDDFKDTITETLDRIYKQIEQALKDLC